MVLSALHLYGRLIAVSVREQMQYRASFLMQTASHMLVTGTEIVAIWAMFDRFGSLRGWTLPQVALFYGLVNVVFSISDATTRGFDIFDRLVKAGDFDRILLRPRTTVLQLMGYEFRLKCLGRTTQALSVLIWALAALDLSWTVQRTALLGVTIAGGVCFFNALFVLQATLAFWTIETLEVMSTLTCGGVQTAEYPMAIYQTWFRKFFTFIVPLACVSYYPLVGVLDRGESMGVAPAVTWLALLAGPAFFIVSLVVWRAGVRHYTSTGS